MINWLLDTTYILPYFGIHVKIPKIRIILRELQKNHSNMIKISNCSLIEGKWKAIRLYQKESNPQYLSRANKALLAFGAGIYFEIVHSWFIPDATEYADQILKEGHRDYMDCWIAGTAKASNYSLVSDDNELKEIISKKLDWENYQIFSWDDFIQNIGIRLEDLPDKL